MSAAPAHASITLPGIEAGHCIGAYFSARSDLFHGFLAHRRGAVPPTILTRLLRSYYALWSRGETRMIDCIARICDYIPALLSPCC